MVPGLETRLMEGLEDDLMSIAEMVCPIIFNVKDNCCKYIYSIYATLQYNTHSLFVTRFKRVGNAQLIWTLLHNHVRLLAHVVLSFLSRVSTD